MEPDESREDQFAEFAWQTTTSTGLADTTRLILDTARTTVGADGCGLTMLRSGGRISSFGESSEIITQSDELQHKLREGPCVDATVEVHNVTASDLGADDRWPRWGPPAAELGLRSIISATLHAAGNRRLGALNVYGYARNQFTPRDVETVRLFAAHATAALWSALESANLRAALETRTQIGQAVGILMHRYDMTPEQASNVLKRYSQQSNTKLRTLADTVVLQRGLPGTSEAGSATTPSEPG